MNIKLILLILLTSATAAAQVKLPPFVSDGMVLQRDVKVNIWGKASPGEGVTISFNGKTYHTKTAVDSTWKTTLDPTAAGGPYEMMVKGVNTIVIKNILAGEVWLCGGQSNMQVNLDYFKAHFADEVKQANNPLIRQFKVTTGYNFNKDVTLKSDGWKEFNPQNAGNFTAVGYFFAKELFKKYQVPIGLINSSFGGTVAQAWVSEDGLKEFPNYLKVLQATRDTISSQAMIGGNGHLKQTPSILFHTMIAPLVGYTIKGVIWYQGEGNSGMALEYRRLFPALIADWRAKWHQGDFPFLYVQLANYNPPNAKLTTTSWAELREAQRMALSLPNTAMAVTHDIGEAGFIHPPNKNTVGYRLSLAARKIAYKEKDIVYSGPIYKNFKVDGNKVVITFDHLGSGLLAKGDDGVLKGFVICDSAHQFIEASALIQGDKVIVWSDKINSPVAVRYAWANNPEGCNLYNKEGLPASLFRTDDWPNSAEQMSK